MPETLPDREAWFVDPNGLMAIRNLELRCGFHRVGTDRPMDAALRQQRASK